MTFFDTHPASFNSCNISNDQVETLPFLAAAEVLAQLLGKTARGGREQDGLLSSSYIVLSIL